MSDSSEYHRLKVAFDAFEQQLEKDVDSTLGLYDELSEEIKQLFSNPEVSTEEKAELLTRHGQIIEKVERNREDIKLQLIRYNTGQKKIKKYYDVK
ncbi:hypothetical protein L1286_17905 [Pseudoalteromonas sp. SMS1]|uniref:hypothetical protein n=1 Tax=Pseudoalteromonas sp. SMS1 TaxID=2908894 RepID=UPI001F4494A2|nr:hypothetical protein [Pseudoalteromonas sp. SMS1]MCF2859362.1 hypothetical protein [Pseudoalteromonas sp. SMS1]